MTSQKLGTNEFSSLFEVYPCCVDDDDDSMMPKGHKILTLFTLSIQVNHLISPMKAMLRMLSIIDSLVNHL